MRVLFLVTLNIFYVSLVFASNVITTSSGDVSGTARKGVILYEDIPYAEPPIGNLRWRAPKEILKKTEIYPQDSNFCIQRPSNLGGADGEDFFVGNEDCLYLDIFVPRKNNHKNLPVMFWIHGGGNTSGLKDLYDFSKLVSRHDVILVRINYRLGPFGWFTHPAIQSFQDGEDKTSNFGTLDIIMALKWVNKNISNFGGDPENVTIFGESAGGHNVLSLLVSNKAKGLFHKAISMSGYTTSISPRDAYNPIKKSSTSKFSSQNVVNHLTEKYILDEFPINNTLLKEQRKILLSLSSKDFFKIYSNRDSYDELPLLTNDGIVIPKIGLKEALSKKEHLNIVPTIAGSNRDEVKLWLSTAKYFVNIDYSIIGSILQIPKVVIEKEHSFEAFNFYRSSSWKIRGVDDPLLSLAAAGNEELFSYRYDWDDHRRLIIANFKKLIGAAHATEIPILTGSYDLVGGYPLSDLIYPPSFSKRYTSKNMMLFWTNFAKYGYPGESTNSVRWEKYLSEGSNKNYLVIDKRKNLKMISESLTLETLSKQLFKDERLSKLERCVVLLQMYTYVGDDQYESAQKSMLESCNRKVSEDFIKENASYIEF